MPYLVGQRTVYMVGERREEFPVDDLDLGSGQVQNYVELKKECRVRGTPFLDPLFDPDKRDVIGTRKNGKKGISVPVVAWKRPTEVDKRYVFGEKDAVGRRYGHDDVAQGRLGDCYYLAALSIVSDNDKWIKFIIPEDNNEEGELGIFHFRFWVNGLHFDVVVDDRLPYQNETDPACAKLKGNEYWPLLIEKAYAKMHGSYAGICSGYTNDALEDFTGGFIESVQFKDEIPTWEHLLPNRHFGVFCGLTTNKGSDSESDAETGIVYGHAYSVLDKTVLTNYDGDTVRLLLLRNPHGHNEWIGDWSDYPTPSPKWDTVSGTDKHRLLTSKDEGQFWISYDDVTNPKNFSGMELCFWEQNLESALVPPTQPLWEWKAIHGKWGPPTTAQPLSGWELIASRPQYRVELKGSGGGEGGATLIVSLMWKGRIHKEAKATLPKLSFRVFEVKDKRIANEPLPYSVHAFTSKQIVQSDDFHKKAAKGRSDREYCTGAVLKDGHYVITPYTDVGVEGNFLLRVIAEGVVGEPASASAQDPENLEHYRGWENGFRDNE